MHANASWKPADHPILIDSDHQIRALSTISIGCNAFLYSISDMSPSTIDKQLKHIYSNTIEDGDFDDVAQENFIKFISSYNKSRNITREVLLTFTSAFLNESALHIGESNKLM